MNIVTSPESKAHREGYNQATVANRQGIFNGSDFLSAQVNYTLLPGKLFLRLILMRLYSLRRTVTF